MKRLTLATILLALALAAPAQAWNPLTVDQANRSLMGIDCPVDDDIRASWRYYENRGLDIVGATYRGGASRNGWNDLYVPWQFDRRSGHIEITVFRVYLSTIDGCHDVVAWRS